MPDGLGIGQTRWDLLCYMSKERQHQAGMKAGFVRPDVNGERKERNDPFTSDGLSEASCNESSDGEVDED